MSDIYFITHTEVEISSEVPVTEWSLSDIGVKRTRAALKQPWMQSIESLYSSKEVKSIEGAKILSVHLDVPFAQVKEFGENDRCTLCRFVCMLAALPFSHTNNTAYTATEAGVMQNVSRLK